MRPSPFLGGPATRPKKLAPTRQERGKQRAKRQELTQNEGKELHNHGAPDGHGNDLAIGPAVRFEAVVADDFAQGDEVQHVDAEVGKLEHAPEPA